jgi:hypothetical protein
LQLPCRFGQRKMPLQMDRHALSFFVHEIPSFGLGGNVSLTWRRLSPLTAQKDKRAVRFANYSKGVIGLGHF